MTDDCRSTVTRLLLEWHDGRRQALDQVFPLVYEELRRLAAGHMRGERAGHTLQATALVHEAFARLVGTEVAARSRAQFLALASRAMRNILVDHTRARQRVKRGGHAVATRLEDCLVLSDEPDPLLLDLDDALRELEARDGRKARAVELHFFGGLTHEEIAGLLEVSVSTVRGDLRFAMAWLAARLADASRKGGPG